MAGITEERRKGGKGGKRNKLCREIVKRKILYHEGGKRVLLPAQGGGRGKTRQAEEKKKVCSEARQGDRFCFGGAIHLASEKL